jgi:GABA permease
VRTVLIVADRTQGGDRLLDLVRERIGQGPCEFWVVVPVTQTAHLAPRRSPGGSRIPVAESASEGPTKSERAAAERRLDETLARLRVAGAKADGALVNDPPLKAVAQCLAHQQFDEIILCTLPSRAYRWMRQDLPSRIRAGHRVPITHIVAAGTELPRHFRVSGPMESTRREESPPSA